MQSRTFFFLFRWCAGTALLFFFFFSAPVADLLKQNEENLLPPLFSFFSGRRSQSRLPSVRLVRAGMRLLSSLFLPECSNTSYVSYEKKPVFSSFFPFCRRRRQLIVKRRRFSLSFLRKASQKRRRPSFPFLFFLDRSTSLLGS